MGFGRGDKQNTRATMKWIAGIVLVAVSFSVNAQRDFTPSKRSDAFGKRDLRDLRNTGLQLQLGPTFMFTKNKTEEGSFDGASRGNYLIEPDGRLGGYVELGLAHFPKKRSKLSLALKTVLVSYYDWGIGFKYLGGTEKTTVNYTDVLGAVISTDEVEGKFYNGFVYGRFSVHKNIHFGGNKNFFLDNSLGVNLDYNVLRADEASDYHTSVSEFASEVKYHDPFVAQLHYGLGFGFRLKRGTYFIPGVRTPILGINEWNGGRPSLNWFASRYQPVLFHLKIINLFEKKNKSGCPTVGGSEDDKKRNKEFMQGN